MKLLYILVLFATQVTFCQKSKKVVDNSRPCIVFVSPGEKSIEELKKKYKDDFYIMADDAGYYEANDGEFIEKSTQFKQYYLDLKHLNLMFPNVKLMEGAKRYGVKNPWFAIMIKNKVDFKITALVDFEEDFKKYYLTYNKSLVLDQKWTGTLQEYVSINKLFIIDTVKNDIDLDGNTDIIISTKDKSEAENLDKGVFSKRKIVLLRGLSNNKFEEWGKNDNVIQPLNSHCSIKDSYDRIVAKNNYFTIEQTTCGDIDFTLKNLYVTFRYSKEEDKILLFKYGVIKTSRANPDKTVEKDYTKIDFGKIDFLKFDLSKFVNSNKYNPILK